MPKLRSPDGPVQLRAIHANVGVEAWYRTQLDLLLGMMTTQAIAYISDAWNEVPPTIGFAQDAPRTTTLLRRALSIWGDAWINRFDRLSLNLATAFADKNQTVTQTQLRAQFRKAGFTVRFQATPKSKEAYQTVIAENIGLIKNMPQQFVKNVESAVWSSVMKGGDLQSLAVELRSKHGIERRRAALIARDQNRKAKAVMENVRRQELGIKFAVWMHSGGGKIPRPSHIGPTMNGKKYALSKGMWDKDEGKFVWPGELINCRCTSRPIIPGLEEYEE